jgi:hypothetical protein
MGNVALTVEIPSESMAVLKKKAAENGISLDELIIQFSNAISANNEEESCPKLDKDDVEFSFDDIKRWEAEADAGPTYGSMKEIREALGV